MDDDRNDPQPDEDIGQDSRDTDPEPAKEQAKGKRPLGGDHSAMPDFTSGPYYTGQVPPDGPGASGGNPEAGGDTED